MEGFIEQMREYKRLEDIRSFKINSLNIKLKQDVHPLSNALQRFDIMIGSYKNEDEKRIMELNLDDIKNYLGVEFDLDNGYVRK